MARFTLDDFEGAISDCTKALELSSRNFEIMYLRGRIRQGTGESHLACVDYKKALEWAPGDWSRRPKIEEYLKKHPEPEKADSNAEKIQTSEEHENPAYTYWMDCEVGAWVRSKLVLQGGLRSLVREINQKLVERSGDKIIIESWGDDFPKGRTELKRKGKEFGSIEEQGEEVIEVAGKKLQCTWMICAQDQDGTKMRLKMWFSRAIPGGMARSEVMPEGKTKVSVTIEAIGWGDK